MSSASSDFVPVVLYNNEKVMLNIVDDRTSIDAPVWMPACVTLAAITPALHGILLSYPKDDDARRDFVDLAMFHAVIEPETFIVSDEFLLSITFTDARDGRVWPQFQVRFKESDEFWTFTAAFAKGKLAARPRSLDITNAFRKVLDVVVGRTSNHDDKHE
ncbi:hypothetical protein ACG7TL_001518 [Trametes sanguinea]